MPITIDADQRSLLRDAIIAELAAMGDVAIHINNGHTEKALRLRRVNQTLLALLDDLGWNNSDDRTCFEITVGEHALLAALSRLSADTADQAHASLEPHLDDLRSAEHAQQAAELYTSLFEQLADNSPTEPTPPSTARGDLHWCHACGARVAHLGGPDQECLVCLEVYARLEALQADVAVDALEQATATAAGYLHREDINDVVASVIDSERTGPIRRADLHTRAIAYTAARAQTHRPRT